MATLSPAVRLECRSVVLKNRHQITEVVVGNLERLASRLADPRIKPISNPGGWLTEALKINYAAQEMVTKTMTKAKEGQQAKLQAEAEAWWADLGVADRNFWEIEGFRRGGSKNTIIKAFLAWQADQRLQQAA